MGTPLEKTDYVLLAVLRKAIGLELKGLKHSSGTSATTRAKVLLDLPRNTSREMVYSIVDQLVTDHLKVCRAAVGQEEK